MSFIPLRIDEKAFNRLFMIFGICAIKLGTCLIMPTASCAIIFIPVSTISGRWFEIPFINEVSKFTADSIIDGILLIIPVTRVITVFLAVSKIAPKFPDIPLQKFVINSDADAIKFGTL